jgi:predicted transcriptional regulator
MKRWIVCAIASCLLATTASAQGAFRCEVNGRTVYSDQPCTNGKLVAPTQDSAEQQQRGKEAMQQVKADNNAVDARIDRRASDEAKARAAERRVAAKAERAAAVEEKKARAKKKKEDAARKKLLKVKKTPTKKPLKPAASGKPA